VKHEPTAYERVNDEVTALLRQMSETSDPKAIEQLDRLTQAKIDELRSLRHQAAR
jgi:hypothetical protein